jgi:hypothetical protein
MLQHEDCCRRVGLSSFLVGCYVSGASPTRCRAITVSLTLVLLSPCHQYHRCYQGRLQIDMPIPPTLSPQATHWIIPKSDTEASGGDVPDRGPHAYFENIPPPPPHQGPSMAKINNSSMSDTI